MKMDLNQIKALAISQRDLNEYIDAELAKCTADDPPLLSDLIVASNGGGIQVLMALEQLHKDSINMPEDQRFKWKIQVMFDEWGNVPQPGEDYILKIKRPYKKGGKPVTIGEINVDKATGVHDEKWINQIPYKVDSKGCISCTYEHAMILIRTFGMHPKTGRGGPPLSMHSKPVDNNVSNCPDGTKKQTHYWRVKEVSKADYEKLPNRVPDNKPKRGRPAKDVTDAN